VTVVLVLVEGRSAGIGVGGELWSAYSWGCGGVGGWLWSATAFALKLKGSICCSTTLVLARLPGRKVGEDEVYWYGY
jgi:hypothetical protein